jgi:hypothetical protein
LSFSPELQHICEQARKTLDGIYPEAFREIALLARKGSIDDVVGQQLYNILESIRYQIESDLSSPSAKSKDNDAWREIQRLR